MEQFVNPFITFSNSALFLPVIPYLLQKYDTVNLAMNLDLCSPDLGDF
ncbi:MAG: hypothetical protein AB1467_03110 [Candidatus Diapherotrites archaeon]